MQAQGITPHNVVRIPSTIDNVFRYWLEFLLPFHHLSPREMDVATAFLKERHYLSKRITDPVLLDRILMSEDSYKKIQQESGVSSSHFQLIKGKLRTKKFFIDHKINPRLIPNINEGDGTFQLLLLFDMR